MSIAVFVRATHLVSSSLAAGLLAMNYLFGTREYLREEPNYGGFSVVTSVVCFVSGAIHLFLLKGSKKLEDEHKPWQYLNELKLFLSILLTPVVIPAQQMLMLEDSVVLAYQFWTLMLIFVISLATKAYREDQLNNFQKDVIESKFMQFQQRYYSIYQRAKETGEPIKVPKVDLAPEEAERIARMFANSDKNQDYQASDNESGSERDYLDKGDSDWSPNEEEISSMVTKTRERMHENIEKAEAKKFTKTE